MSVNLSTILVRADASAKMGTGHVMRCFALSEGLLARGHKVIFASHDLPESLANRIELQGLEVLSVSSTEAGASSILALASQTRATHAVFDGYHLADAFEGCLAKTNVKSLRFDDLMPGRHCSADVVVNASPFAEQKSYEKWAQNARILLGPRYLSFRSEVVEASKSSTRNKNAEKNSLFINFGGSDPLGLTRPVILAIAEAIPKALIEVVTGPAYSEPNRVSELPVERLRHHHNSRSLADIMQRALIAVSAGGLTIAELALFRVPTILTVTAENQIEGAKVSWCRAILPGTQPASQESLVKQIVEQAKTLWQSETERLAIIKRIPKDIDTGGTDRIIDALLEGHQ